MQIRHSNARTKIVIANSEVWKPIISYEGLYEASNVGRVRRLKRHGKHRVLKQRKDHRGYMTVGLSKNGKTKYLKAHRCVLFAFSGPCPEGMEACHFPDSDKTNNAIENLRWDTHAANVVDQGLLGQLPMGEGHSRAKITATDVERMFDLRCCGCLIREIANHIGVSTSLVQKILAREIWRHVNV